MMDLDHAKTVVNHLLTATDIKAVYYVDDKFQKDAEIDDHIEKFLIAIENVIQINYNEFINAMKMLCKWTNRRFSRTCSIRWQ